MEIIFCIFVVLLTFVFFKAYKSRKVTPYKYDLAIAAIFKDEAPYLKEWIEFHRLIGVQHFYLINNLSTDNYLEVLQPYIQSGLVEIIDWPVTHASQKEFVSLQCKAYSYMIKKVRKKVKWLALIDTDEFLFTVNDVSLLDFLSNYEEFGGLVVHWQTYGTSYVPKIPEDKLLIETLTKRAPNTSDFNFYVKSIVRPERVKKCMDPHFMIYKKGFFQVNSDKFPFQGSVSPYVQANAIRINHYTVRDEHFFHTVKIPRINVWDYDLDAYKKKYNACNEVEDKAIFRFIPKMSQELVEIA